MKKLMSILLATVMCVTCGGMDCSAARAKAFSGRTHSKSCSSSRSNNSCGSSCSSSCSNSRSCSSWWPFSWSSRRSSSCSSCSSCPSNRSDIIVVNNNNNNVAQTKSDNKEKEIIFIEDGKEATPKAVIIKEKEDKSDNGVLWGTLALVGGILLAPLFGADRKSVV